MINTFMAFLGLLLLFILSLGEKKSGHYLPPKNQAEEKPRKIKPKNFGQNSPALRNDRVRHSLHNFTNGD